MGRVRGKHTKPEKLVRQLVHGMGFRFRLHSRKLPGCPDLVFPSKKKVIFIHGCFWHRHNATCSLTRMPKSRLEFWVPKLEGNKSRDRKNRAQLKRLGWRVLVLWECQLSDRDSIVNRIQGFLANEIS